MAIRREVEILAEAGPLPSEDEATPEALEEWEGLLKQVVEPLSDDEAQLLLATFGPDGCFGLAWFVLHLIESAPGALTAAYVVNMDNEWVKLLEDRRSP
jgi:hypothetical protein